jgi:septum formation protein
MGLWLYRSPLVLASGSTVRRAVLESAGIPVEPIPADLDERVVEAQSEEAEPGAVAALLAREKARKVAGKLPGRVVLGADQVLAMERRRFSKPHDRAGAREQLLALSGRTHELLSAAAVVRDDGVVFEAVDRARLTMRAFSPAFLESYLDLAGSAVTASVGAYQVEGPGIQLFEQIEGDHFGILGLPLLPILAFFRREGWLAA